MNKILFMLAGILMAGFVACKKTDFSDAYSDPSKIDKTTVDKQFAGAIYNYKDYVVPSYWNYFVILRPTVNRYTQAVGWANESGQYVPGGGAVTDRWNNFYSFLAQYRELQKVYAALSAGDQADRRIFMITATVFFYDQTEKVVDLHGDIPWSKAGMLSTNNGDYNTSYPGYDDAATIYTKMLDDLKAYADTLNSISFNDAVKAAFKNQDLINGGDLTLWKKYCNSLRLRMLMRVSGVSAFQSRASTEIAAILANPAKYPLVTSNADNIQIDIYAEYVNGAATPNKNINATGFQSGLEDWNGNLAGKVMIDHMTSNGDPRLPVMFQPGDSAGTTFRGLDPSLNSGTQTNLINSGTISIYNRSTISRNDYFPGILINAAEVNFYLAEYYLKAGSLSAAQTAYETGIKQSIDYYYALRAISNDNSAPAVTTPTTTQINAYISSPAVNWTLATTTADKLKLIALQKWIHYSVVQPLESWAEVRRLDSPIFTFWTDNANAQKQPPYRWQYPSSEITYNTTNYQAVKSKDNLSTKAFWDLN